MAPVFSLFLISLLAMNSLVVVDLGGQNDNKILGGEEIFALQDPNIDPNMIIAGLLPDLGITEWLHDQWEEHFEEPLSNMTLGGLVEAIWGYFADMVKGFILGVLDWVSNAVRDLADAVEKAWEEVFYSRVGDTMPETTARLIFAVFVLLCFMLIGRLWVLALDYIPII